MQRLGRALPAHHERHEGKKKNGHTSHLITCRYIFFFNQAVFSPLFFAYLSQYIGLPVISDFKSHICFILSNFMAAACNIVSLL